MMSMKPLLGPVAAAVLVAAAPAAQSHAEHANPDSSIAATPVNCPRTDDAGAARGDMGTHMQEMHRMMTTMHALRSEMQAMRDEMMQMRQDTQRRR